MGAIVFVVELLQLVLTRPVSRIEKAKEAFLKACIMGANPVLDARDPDVPVGLKVFYLYRSLAVFLSNQGCIESRCNVLCKCVPPSQYSTVIPLIKLLITSIGLVP